MIPRIHKRGQRTIGLLHYLYGPGTHEEHIDPHLVASWDGIAPDPGRDPNATLKQLQQLLDQPVDGPRHAARRPTKHVWHCSVAQRPRRPHPHRRGMGRDRPPHGRRHRHRPRGRRRRLPLGSRTPRRRPHPHRRHPRPRRRPQAPTSTTTPPAPRPKPASSKPNSACAASTRATAQPPSAPPAPRDTRRSGSNASARRGRSCGRGFAVRWPAPRARRSSSPGSPPPASSSASAPRPPVICSATRSPCPGDRNKDQRAGVLLRLQARPGPVPAPHPPALHRQPAQRLRW